MSNQPSTSSGFSEDYSEDTPLLHQDQRAVPACVWVLQRRKFKDLQMHTSVGLLLWWRCVEQMFQTLVKFLIDTSSLLSGCCRCIRVTQSQTSKR